MGSFSHLKYSSIALHKEWSLQLLPSMTTRVHLTQNGFINIRNNSSKVLRIESHNNKRLLHQEWSGSLEDIGKYLPILHMVQSSSHHHTPTSSQGIIPCSTHTHNESPRYKQGPCTLTTSFLCHMRKDPPIPTYNELYLH